MFHQPRCARKPDCKEIFVKDGNVACLNATSDDTDLQLFTQANCASGILIFLIVCNVGKSNWQKLYIYIDKVTVRLSVCHLFLLNSMKMK